MKTGRSWPHYGRFIRLDRGRAIEYTWVSEATRGMESVVSIALAPRDRGTELSLRHANLPDDEMGRQHKDGWTWYLNVLVEPFERAVSRSPTASVRLNGRCLNFRKSSPLAARCSH